MIGVALGWVLLPEVYNKIVQGLDTPVHILCVPLCASVCLCVCVCVRNTAIFFFFCTRGENRGLFLNIVVLSITDDGHRCTRYYLTSTRMRSFTITTLQSHAWGVMQREGRGSFGELVAPPRTM